MFKIATLKEIVKVDPKFLSLDNIEEALKIGIKNQIEGKTYENIGTILAIIKIVEFGEGEIVPEDPMIHFPVVFDALVFSLEEQEVVYGIVVDITEIGAFVRVASLDTFVHISQIMNDKIIYDQKNSIFVGKKTKRKLQEGEVVRARVVSISSLKEKTRIALTMRQPMLGALKWIEAEKKEIKKKEKGKK
ncbi:MAG: DNA-directed RNA polymerase [Candidatus Aenigmatarchaeota archaeon]